MTRFFFITLTALATLALASCETPERNKGRDRNRQHPFGYHPSDEMNQNTEPVMTNVPPDTNEPTTGTTQPPPPPTREDRTPTASTNPPPVKKDLPYAVPVPGKPGFVTSPYRPYDGYVDVRGYPPGTEVKDPYSQKVFLVP